MQKKIPLLIIALCLFPHCSNKEKLNLKNIINTCYAEISGFGISPEDHQNIEAHGCASTYGEITFEAVEKLIEKLHFTDSDVFYDLGCGVGKMVTQIYLGSPVKKSVGVELSCERADKALKIQQTLRAKNIVQEKRVLAFYKESFLDTDLADATVVYLASTCFSDELIKKVTYKLANLKSGLRVITLKKLAENEKFKLIDEFILPMTWSDSTNAYLYQLN